MVAGLFVVEVGRIGDGGGELAGVEELGGLVCVKANDEEAGGWRGGIAAEPEGVGAGDNGREVAGRAEDLDGAGFAVVAGEDGEVLLIGGGEGGADVVEGIDESLPAELFAEVG